MGSPYRGEIEKILFTGRREELEKKDQVEVLLILIIVLGMNIKWYSFSLINQRKNVFGYFYGVLATILLMNMPFQTSLWSNLQALKWVIIFNVL